MNIVVTNEKGETFDFQENGYKTMIFNHPSPYVQNETEGLDGSKSLVVVDSKFGYVPFNTKVYLNVEDKEEYVRQRHKLFSFLGSGREFGVVEEAEPNKMWKLRLEGAISPDRVDGQRGFFEIPFVSYSSFARSIGTTLRPEGDMMSQVTTNYGDPPIQYEFNTTSFSVWNDSDTDIDPREHDLTIEFKGASSGLTIKNLTTGDTWSYTGDTVAEDVIRLEGIRSLKNGSSIFGQTNRQLITLVQGWNEFEITGATDFSIGFDFRFLYV
ncbi:phage tail family protein [Bacillus sp. MCCB 382]|uniref:phage tail domain-containing protein n=1 Tax=Bacillus sp. MCCB 382 TaxID=2860197 RepID=UPI001C59B15F|nr:phage tail family protein [Bacillus sp. MCCB 382]